MVRTDTDHRQAIHRVPGLQEGGLWQHPSHRERKIDAWDRNPSLIKKDEVSVIYHRELNGAHSVKNLIDTRNNASEKRGSSSVISVSPKVKQRSLSRPHAPFPSADHVRVGSCDSRSVAKIDARHIQPDGVSRNILVKP